MFGYIQFKEKLRFLKNKPFKEDTRRKKNPKAFVILDHAAVVMDPKRKGGTDGRCDRRSRLDKGIFRELK